MITRRRNGVLIAVAIALAASFLPFAARDARAAISSNLVEDVNSGSGSSAPDLFTRLGDLALFVANDGVHGRELWSIDLSDLANGASMVKDVNPTGSAEIGEMIAVGPRAFFTANDGVHGKELWVTDGTAANTTLVADINDGSLDSGLAGLTALGQYVYFRACNDGDPHSSCAFEVWRSDGTTTERWTNIYPTNGSNPTGFARVGARMFFIADDGAGTIDVLHANSNFELWVTDGSTTSLVKDINPPVQTPSEGSWYISNRPPKDLGAVDDILYFCADDGHGYSPWRSDGTTPGTYALTDQEAYPGSCESLNGDFEKYGNYVYFGAKSGADAELWRTDGTPASGAPFKNLSLFGSSNPANFVSANGLLFFNARRSDVAGSTGQELWRSDGTDPGTVLVRDIIPGSTGSNPRAITAVGDSVVFFAKQPLGNVFDLVVSTGTAAGTFRSGYSTSGSGSPRFLLPVGTNGVLFAGNDGTTGVEPWLLTLGPDFDDDGILNGVDESPIEASTRFADSDEPPTSTIGTVTNKPLGVGLTIGDASPGGVSITVTGDPTKRVSIRLDGKGGTYHFPPGTYVLTDPDVESSVQSLTGGPATVEIGGTTVVIDAGEEALITEHEDGAVSVEAVTGTISVNGQPLSPGGTVVLATVNAKLKLSIKSKTFEMSGTFQPALGQSIAPASEAIFLRIGTFSTTIPAGSLKPLTKGRYAYSGTPPGTTAKLDVQVAPAGGSAWTVLAKGTNVTLTGTVNPVTVAIAIGNDTASNKVTATFS